MNKIQVFQVVDLLDLGCSWVLPELANRINQHAFKITHDKRSETFTRKFLARLMLGDQCVGAAVAVVHYPPGEIVGHAIVELLQDGEDKICFILQAEVDPGYPGTVDKLLTIGHNWGKCLGASKMRLEADLNNYPAKTWKRVYQRYGFKPVYYVMEREINDRLNHNLNPVDNPRPSNKGPKRSTLAGRENAHACSPDGSGSVSTAF